MRRRVAPGCAGLLNNTHRHVSKKVSTVDASFPHERSLPLVELLSDGSEILGAKVRALKQAVQGVHATEQAHLFLMIQRSHDRVRYTARVHGAPCVVTRSKSPFHQSRANKSMCKYLYAFEGTVLV